MALLPLSREALAEAGLALPVIAGVKLTSSLSKYDTLTLVRSCAYGCGVVDLTSRNTVLIATVTTLAVAGGGIALGQATADHPARAKHAKQRARSAQDCITALGKPRNAAEAEVRRKLERELAKHPVKLPPGWTFGGCSGGTATTTAP